VKLALSAHPSTEPEPLGIDGPAIETGDALLAEAGLKAEVAFFPLLGDLRPGPSRQGFEPIDSICRDLSSPVSGALLSHPRSKPKPSAVGVVTPWPGIAMDRDVLTQAVVPFFPVCCQNVPGPSR
jgi:hypothetical protein